MSKKKQMKVTRVPPCPVCSLSGRAFPGPSALSQQVWALVGAVGFCPHHTVRGASVLDIPATSAPAERLIKNDMFVPNDEYFDKLNKLRPAMEHYNKELIAKFESFLKNPVYTSDEYPFVTLMQSACQHFRRDGDDPECDCGNCKYMERGEELIAVCRCPENRRSIN